MTPEEDRATAIGNIHKNGKYRACGSAEISSQTDTHTDILITILPNLIEGRSND